MYMTVANPAIIDYKSEITRTY